MRRRKFLSMMASATYALTRPGWAMDRLARSVKVDPSKNFYVWVHGIFGITFKKRYGGISIVSPSLTMPRNRHLYKVGRVTRYDEPNKLFIGATDIPLVTTFQFEGLDKSQGQTQTEPGPKDKLRVKGTLTYKQPDMLYFELPYPQSIIPLRFASAKAYDTSGQPVPNANNPPPTGDLTIPLTHVLEYDGVAAKDVKLTYVDGSGKRQALGDPSSSNHFHLYAEPDPACYDDSSCHDASFALEALLDCYRDVPEFGLMQAQPCPSLNNITSFASDLWEQFGLFEWVGKCAEPVGGTAGMPRTTISAHECPQLMVIES